MPQFGLIMWKMKWNGMQSWCCEEKNIFILMKCEIVKSTKAKILERWTKLKPYRSPHIFKSLDSKW